MDCTCFDKSGTITDGGMWGAVATEAREMEAEVEVEAIPQLDGWEDIDTQCDLCHHPFNGKNKTRCKQDHLIKQHFHDYFRALDIEKDSEGLFCCPENCGKKAKLKQDIFRHLGGVHKKLKTLLDAHQQQNNFQNNQELEMQEEMQEAFEEPLVQLDDDGAISTSNDAGDIHEDMMDQLPEEQLGDLIEQRQLSFLVPVLANKADMWRQLENDPSPEGLLAWIKKTVPEANKKDQGFVSTLITTIVRLISESTTLKNNTTSVEKADTDKEKEMITEFKTVLSSYLVSPELQLVAVYALQVFCFSRSFPKGMLLRWFVALYEEDIIDEHVFLNWKEDVNDSKPGKGKALSQVNLWLHQLPVKISRQLSADDSGVSESVSLNTSIVHHSEEVDIVAGVGIKRTQQQETENKRLRTHDHDHGYAWIPSGSLDVIRYFA